MISKNRIKFIKALQQKKNRDESDLFVLEGEKNVEEVLNWKSDRIDSVYVTADFDTKVLREKELGFELVSEQELKQISGLKTPNKALVVCKKWLNEIREVDFTLALDGIQDPGNLGTLIRLADWFGVKQVFCSEDTVEVYNPKVVQASMGSVFRVNVYRGDLAAFLGKTQLPVYGALLEGENVYQMELKPRGILVLGNEGKGISHEVQKLITDTITIPRFGNAESLNVSTAGAVLLSEFFRKS